jgi:hypothetical protein
MKQARKLACLIEGCSTFLLLLIDYFYCCTRTIGSAVNHLILLFFDVVLLTKLRTNISIAGVNETAENMHPTQYSFWLARNMPLQDSLRHALLEKPSTQERLGILFGSKSI